MVVGGWSTDVVTGLNAFVVKPALGDRHYSYDTAFVSCGNRPWMIGDRMTDSLIVLTDLAGVAY